MLKKLASKISKYLPHILAMLFVAGFGVFAAWTEPPTAPPDGNVSAPINVSSAEQIKAGNLTVNALGISASGNALLVPNGNVGIGTASPGAKLDVQGGDLKVGTVDIKGDSSISTNLNAQKLGGYTAQDIFNLISPVIVSCSGETLYGGTQRGTIPGAPVRWKGWTQYNPERTYTYLWSGSDGLGGSGSLGHGEEPAYIEKAYSAGGIKDARFMITDDLGQIKEEVCYFRIYDDFRYAFKTSAKFNPALGGIAEADNTCNIYASVLPGSYEYKAWLSAFGISSPSTRFTRAAVPYFTSVGEMIAYNWDDLTDGTLFTPISYDENGVNSPFGLVFSGTKENGEAFSDGPCMADPDTSGTFGIGFQDCNRWSSNSPMYGGIVGFANKTDRNWSAAREYGFAPEYPSCPYCSWMSLPAGRGSLYCFGQ